MSEPTTDQVDPASGVTDELVQQWLNDELLAHKAAEAGNLDAAIEKWEAILADDQRRTFFAEGGEDDAPDGPLLEIAAGLADAYLRKADQDDDESSRAKGMAIVGQYGLELVTADAAPSKEN